MDQQTGRDQIQRVFDVLNRRALYEVGIDAGEPTIMAIHRLQQTTSSTA
jgi:hypothetical protein